MGKFNKTTVTALIGAACFALATFFPDYFTPQKVSALSGLMSTFAVFLVPNAGA